MAPSRSQKSTARAKSSGRSKPARKPSRPPARKAAPAKAAPPKPTKAPAKKGAGAKAAAPAPAPLPIPSIPRADGRRHLLSLSFVRDGDEFLARMETDSGHITELKNRALDQLLTLVAGELEDLLE